MNKERCLTVSVYPSTGKLETKINLLPSDPVELGEILAEVLFEVAKGYTKLTDNSIRSTDMAATIFSGLQDKLVQLQRRSEMN